jgi:hypothetical protein
MSEHTADHDEVEAVARAIYEEANPPDNPWCESWNEVGDFARNRYRRMARAALAARRPATPTCGDLSPSINFGGDGEAERFMCELPIGHDGAHQHNQDPHTPMLWVARRPATEAEQAVARVRALADELERVSNADPSAEGIFAEGAYADAADRIRAALNPNKGE